MTNSQVFQVAAATFAQGFDVLQGRCGRQHMLAANPAGHYSVHLPSHRFINFVTRVGEFAHGKQCTSLHSPLSENSGSEEIFDS